jgi:hypothetical protein
LVTVAAFWSATYTRRPYAVFAFGVTAVVAYVLGVLTAFHSGLFLSALGIFSAGMILFASKERAKWVVTCAIVGAGALATIGIYALLMNEYDRYMVYGQGGVGGGFIDDLRLDRLYYFNWLRRNLSYGLMLATATGFVLMVVREGRRGVLVTLLFWVPVLLLTFAIGYRRPRFMFFAFPFYLAAASYAAVVVAQWLTSPKETLWQRTLAVGVALLSVRVLMSAILLAGDSLYAATGADTTLARHHPRWRESAHYVRDHVQDDEVVISTTYYPALYYVGRVDNWYPTRALWGEVDEAGRDDLKGLKELKAYVAENPKGYFLSDWWRFERNREMQEERQWVAENMTPLWFESSPDITIWRWDEKSVKNRKKFAK